MLSFSLRFDKAQIGISGGESGKLASFPPIREGRSGTGTRHPSKGSKGAPARKMLRGFRVRCERLEGVFGMDLGGATAWIIAKLST
jgi:hypothetical protein